MDEQISQKISLANVYFQNQHYEEAIRLYDCLIEQNDQNYILYCNRSSALFKQCKFKESLEDAIRAIELNPRSIKAHYREGMALQSLNRPIDAIIAYSKGLVIDKENIQLLNCLLSALKNTEFWSSIEPALNRLKSIDTKFNSNHSPFIISLIGQQILTLDYFLESSILLDCSSKIDTDSLKLKSSIYASLAVAYWKLAIGNNNNNKLNNINLALDAMKNDLNCVIKLNDLDGQYRALTNLASAHYQLKQFDEALNNYRAQLDTARLMDDKSKVLETLKLIANVYQQMKNYKNAIVTYEEILNLAKQQNDLNLILKSSKTLSTLFAQSNDLHKAIDYQEKVCKLIENVAKFEKLRPKAYLEMSALCEKAGDYQKSIEISQKLLNLNIGDKSLQLLLYERLANNELKLSNLSNAKKWFESELKLSELTENREIRLNCLMNLANVNHKLKNYQLSIDLNEQVLKEFNDLNDETFKKRKFKVLGNLGELYFIQEDYSQSIRNYREQLNLDMEHIPTERLETMKRLSICYKKKNELDDTLKLYFDILNFTKDQNDLDGQLWSFYHIALLYSTNGAYEQAISTFQEYLTLIEQNQIDHSEQCRKVNHILGLIFFKLDQLEESFNYFRKDAKLVQQMKQYVQQLNISPEYTKEPNTDHHQVNNINDLITCTKVCCLLLSPKNESNQSIEDIIQSFDKINLF